MTSLADVHSLDEYLTRYGELLADQTTERLAPLQAPGRDPTLPILDTLLRPAFPAQAHVITAAVKSLRRNKSVNIVGEMGTGKTYIGMSIAHAVANGRPYRALVMAPDHLIKKWGREIQEKTIPGATVYYFDSWRDVLALCDRRDEPPTGPEWYVLGRDQSKYMPVWEPRAVTRIKLHRIRDQSGKTQSVKFPRLYCPKCGAMIVNRKSGDGPGDGTPLLLDDLRKSKKFCTAMVSIRSTKPLEEGEEPPALERECGERLWQYVACRTAEQRAAKKARGNLTSQPYRWSPAEIIHKRLRHWFDYFILDEAHEEKGVDSAQGTAAGKLAAACKKTIALTGTLIGGYSWHVFPLIYRTAPSSLVDAGFHWGKDMPFNECYGRIEQQITTRAKEGEVVENSSHSLARKIVSNRKVCRPGIMPSLFGDHLMANTIFLSLEEISDALPPRPTDEVFPVEMDADQKEAYNEIASQIGNAIAPMIRRGDISLMGKMLQATLGWPDWPFGWKESRYLEDFDILDPKDFDPARVFPKERALIDLVKSEASRNRQVWVYVQNTGDRNVLRRLGDLLRAEGLRVGTLTKDVPRAKREEWIHKRGREFDVAVSHPDLVKTGLDLFDLDQGVNFCTIAWFQTGYNPFTLRQASRRAWRIGQPEDCRVCYFYYNDTMQARAMALMGAKLVAAEQLDGRFSAEGLAAMASDESAEMAMARSLSQRIDSSSAERAWEKIALPARPMIPSPRPSVPLVQREVSQFEPAAPSKPIKQLSLFGDD